MRAKALKIVPIFLGVILFDCAAYLFLMSPAQDNAGSYQVSHPADDGTSQVPISSNTDVGQTNANDAVAMASSPPSGVDDQYGQVTSSADTDLSARQEDTADSDLSAAPEEASLQGHVDFGPDEVQANVQQSAAFTENAPNSASSEEQTTHFEANDEEVSVQQPVAFAEDAPSPASSEEQSTDINALRQQFIEPVGGYEQDTSDPQYLRRSQDAQQLLDEQLRAQLGEEVFNQLENENVTHVPSLPPDEQQ
jgi:hypothetical protein